MKCFWKSSVLGAVCSFWIVSTHAHDLPLSYVDLRVDKGGIDATIQASAKSFARDLRSIDEGILLDPAQMAQQKEPLFALIAAGLTIRSNGTTLRPELRGIEPLPGPREVRVQLHFQSRQAGETIQVRCELFSADQRHKTFLNIYQGDQLKHQGVFDREVSQIEYVAKARQSIVAVVKQFLFQGVHHIFIGPDHILFVVGLLLLGGTIGQLLKIITAFTVAHSVTLVLATLNILNPPPRLIEPAIALSIIFVGAHALLRLNGGRDWRLFFAFGFGFVHGFGFANVLREMTLPRAALGWSLFSFNIGVELGQACIVLAVTPLVALVYQKGSVLAGKFVTASSFCVIFAGSFWFAQRVFGNQ
jgi:hydrogenase/urease accessory protein HupE